MKRPPQTTPKRRAQKRNGQPLRVGQFKKIVQQELSAVKASAEALIVRPEGRPKGSKAFQSVVRARELMAESSALAVRMLTKASKVAASRGDSRPAEFLLKHVSVQDDKGKQIRPLASSVDKLEGEGGSRVPVINIGWIVPKSVDALPPHAIDVLALPPHED